MLVKENEVETERFQNISGLITKNNDIKPSVICGNYK